MKYKNTTTIISENFYARFPVDRQRKKLKLVPWGYKYERDSKLKEYRRLERVGRRSESKCNRSRGGRCLKPLRQYISKQ